LILHVVVPSGRIATGLFVCWQVKISTFVDRGALLSIFSKLNALMTLFILFAALLVIIPLAYVLLPLWRGAKGAPTSAERKEANLAIFRDQLAELEREKEEGGLAEVDFEQAQRELRRRLLEEIPADSDDTVAAVAGSSRKTALVIALLVPLLAAGTYLLIGKPQALSPLATMPPGQMTPEKIQGMVASLGERLKSNPGDAQGWLMLARSYKSLGRNAEAAEAYGKGESAMEGDPDLLTDYADLLAMLAGGSLDGKPLALINKALHADPDHVLALWLAGTAAYNRRDYPDAVIFWERAVRVLPEGSEDGRMLSESVAEAKRRSNVKIDPAKVVAGRVELAPALAERVSPGDTVFIFARPTDGTRVPLAAIKLRVSDLPFSFVLDDTLAMMPDKVISGQSSVIVEARISRSGNAIAANGDLQSKPATVRVGERKLKLLVDQVVTR
jgi:cytochrome c-type biogenesis protein CcmH